MNTFKQQLEKACYEYGYLPWAAAITVIYTMLLAGLKVYNLTGHSYKVETLSVDNLCKAYPIALTHV